MKTCASCIRYSLLVLVIVVCNCTGPVYTGESSYNFGRRLHHPADTSLKIFTHDFRRYNLHNEDIRMIDFYLSEDIILFIPDNRAGETHVIPQFTSGHVVETGYYDIVVRFDDVDVKFEKHRTASFSTGLEYVLSTQIDRNKTIYAFKNGRRAEVRSKNTEDIKLLFDGYKLLDDLRASSNSGRKKYRANWNDYVLRG